MHFSKILAFVAPAVALPSMAALRTTATRPWEPATDSDSRGPCPMLNTLANHGYLPHSGRNITVQDIGDAIFEAANWSQDFGLIPGAGAFAALGGLSVIDLEMLNNRTAGIERPASLARGDDSNTVLPDRVRTVINDSSDPEYLTAVSFGHSRARLEAVSPLTPTQQNPARGEAAFVLMLTVDGEAPDSTDPEIDISKLRAFKDQAYMFLSEERFPVELGWEPSERVVQLADVAPISAAIKAAQDVVAEN